MKDGLNDAHTFNPNSSLWDSTDQCKPSFYEVANVGINYNRSDSLIAFTTTLNKNNYSTTQWDNFTAALNSALTIKNQNFSSTSPADTALGGAMNRLKAALDILTDVKTPADNTISSFALDQNYPNPFNPTTTIQYDIPVTSHVKLSIYDVLGRVVTTLVNTNQAADKYTVQWNASAMGSGVYFYQIDAQSQDGAKNFTSVKKLIFMKSKSMVGFQ